MARVKSVKQYGKRAGPAKMSIVAPLSPQINRSRYTASHRNDIESRNAMDLIYLYDNIDNARLDATRSYMASRRGKSPMTGRWRSEGNHRNHTQHIPRDRQERSRSRSPPTRRPEARPATRGRFERDEYLHRPPRKRDYSPEPRKAPPRRVSISPARSPRLPPARNRYPVDSTFTSRDSSPARFPKRRRTRSPSPSDWSERGFGDKRRFSRSRSRDRYDSRDTGPPSRRGFSPPPRRSPQPRSARPVSRDLASDVDTYIPERRRPQSPPRRPARRSPSPHLRSASPPPRKRSLTPPRRHFSRPESPSSRYESPLPNRRGPPREDSPEPPVRRKPTSKTPSVAGDFDQEPMDGPFPARGHYANPNYVPRGRGQRPYYNNRGSYRGSPIGATPNSSHQGSPHSNASHHGGRGNWDGPQQHFNHAHSNTQSFRQSNYSGNGRGQDDYARNQQQPPNHPFSNHSGRPFRGGRGPHRGANYSQNFQDRRFSGPDASQETSTPYRGRGGTFHNAPWNQGRGRGGGPHQAATGPNSIRTAPALLHKGARDRLSSPKDEDNHQRGHDPQDEYSESQDDDQVQPSQDASQNHKDSSKFSFAFKSKPPPQSPAKPPADLISKAKVPPSRPASDRPPPTQPRANKFSDKRAHIHSVHPDRRRDDQEPPFRPPKGPQQQYHQHNDRSKPLPPSGPRTRSRSPPPKKLKQDNPPSSTAIKPTLTPEMAASDSVYFRRPGNESVVGAGTYGKVFKAVHIFTKHEVALKKIRMEGERDGFPITAVREIKLLQNLRHKHVVALQEVMVEKNECFMVFEYMSHDLTGLINHPTFKLTAAHKKDLGRQMFEGLEFLHRRGVMHRDIKAANLLISNRGQLKYADFGLARFYTKSRRLDYTNRVITIWYRPPELLLGETQYGPAVDIWSAACVFMEMFTRKAIFPGEGGELSQLEKIYNVLGTPSKTEWPGIVDMPWYELMSPAVATTIGGDRRKRAFESQFSDILSPAALELVTQIFRYDPATRPDAAAILDHEYFVSEDPEPSQCTELADVGGEWHEYESKAHRKENERKEKEKRREEYVREREKRKAKEAGLEPGSIEHKKLKAVGGQTDGARVDEVPAAPLPIGEEDEENGHRHHHHHDFERDGDGDDGMSDGEGSARMSMS